MHVSFFYPLEWYILVPARSENLSENQDTLMFNVCTTATPYCDRSLLLFVWFVCQFSTLNIHSFMWDLKSFNSLSPSLMCAMRALQFITSIFVLPSSVLHQSNEHFARVSQGLYRSYQHVLPSNFFTIFLSKSITETQSFKSTIFPWKQKRLFHIIEILPPTPHYWAPVSLPHPLPFKIVQNTTGFWIFNSLRSASWHTDEE